jgi:hypothetical protein
MADTIQPSSPTVRIALTDDQRRRIHSQTGREVTEIEVNDPDGWLSVNMPSMLPIEVEKLAYRYLDRQADQEAISAADAVRAAQEKKATEEANKKVQALEKELSRDVQEIQDSVAAAFAVEAQAVDIARKVAQAALAAALAAAKKK